jgi:nicotinic acid mononucleotide adenylyltransferase
MDPEKLSQRKLAILVGSGSFNPLTRMHLRTFFLAKQYLESHLGYVVLGSLLSPAHAVTVRERYRTNPQEILPAPHRLAIAQLLVSNSQWVSIDPWEMTRRRAMDYLSLLEHVQQLIQASFPSSSNDSTFVPGVHVPDIRLVYVCKGNSVPKLSPQALKSLPCHCVSVCRTQESDILRTSLTGKWNGVISVVEDAAILDASFDMVTSRKVRDKIKAGESVETLVGGKIQEYCLMHKLGPKMNGVEEWTTEESQMPKIASRPAEPTLRSQQLQLQLGSIRSHNSLMQSPMSLNSHNSNQFTFNNINNNNNNNNSNIQRTNGQPRTVPVQAMQPIASPSLLQKNGLASLGVAYSVK